MHALLRIIMVMCCALSMGLSPHMIAHAQIDTAQDVETLDDILNPDRVQRDGWPVTLETLANDYYSTCVSDDDGVFTADQRNMLCACTAANMAKKLTVEDFNNLDKQTIEGKDARGKAIAFSYLPCMQYVFSDIVRADCYRSPQLSNIITGKKTLCQCTVNHFEQYMSRDGTFIIMEALKHEPETLNPLAYYFKHKNYKSQHRHFVKQCHFHFRYNLDNR